MKKDDKKRKKQEKIEALKKELLESTNEIKNEIEKIKDIDPKAYEELVEIANKIEQASINMNTRKYKIKMSLMIVLFFIILVVFNSISIAGVLGISHEFINFSNPVRYLYLIPSISTSLVILTSVVYNISILKREKSTITNVILNGIVLFMFAIIDYYFLHITKDFLSSIFIIGVIIILTLFFERTLFKKFFFR